MPVEHADLFRAAAKVDHRSASDALRKAMSMYADHVTDLAAARAAGGPRVDDAAPGPPHDR